MMQLLFNSQYMYMLKLDYSELCHVTLYNSINNIVAIIVCMHTV